MKEIKEILAANCYIDLKRFSYDCVFSNVWVIVLFFSRMAYQHKLVHLSFHSIVQEIHRNGFEFAYTVFPKSLYMVACLVQRCCTKWVLNVTKV